MSESRIHDFGRPLSAAELNAAQGAMFGPNVLYGMNLSASSDGIQLDIAPGAIITIDGVIIINDQYRAIEFTPTSSAALYTVISVHSYSSIQGGKGSVLELREIEDGDGNPIFGDSTHVSDGVVVGWINYPGGSVLLADSMIFEAFRGQVVSPFIGDSDSFLAHINDAIDILPPIEMSPGVYVTTEDSDVTVAHSLDAYGFPISVVTNGHGSLSKTATIVTYGRNTISKPKRVVIDVLTQHASTSVTVRINVDGTYTLVGTITGIISTQQTLRIPDSIFASGSPLRTDVKWALEIVVSIPSTKEVTIKRIYVGAESKPKEP